MIKAVDAAKLFIEIGSAQAESDLGDAMTNMRVNKLLFFAQGYALARLGRPLFNDRIEAWEHGPVVPEIYDRYKKFGKNPISDTPSSRGAFSDEEYSILFDVIEDTQQISTFGLVEETHKPGTPWSRVYSESRRNEIPLSIIKNFFDAHTPQKRTLKQMAIRPVHTEGGVPVFRREQVYG